MNKEKYISYIPAVIIGGWLLEVYNFTNHFFEKAYVDQLSLVLLMLFGYLAGTRISNQQVPVSVSTLVILLFTVISLPISYELIAISNYSALPIYFGVLIASIILGTFKHNVLALTFPVLVGIFASWIFEGSFLFFGLIALIGILFDHKKKLLSMALGIAAVAIMVYSTADRIKYFSTQKNYFDRVISSDSTRFQNIDITEWKGNKWFYSDTKNQFSTFDYFMYYEPFVHPAMHIANQYSNILVIGSENGILVSELLKYKDVQITLLPIDRDLIEIVRNNEMYSQINNNSLDDPRVRILQEPVFDFLSNCIECYDLIFVDAPDPVDVETNQYFTLEFFQLVKNSVSKSGLIVSQTLSPYLSPDSFELVLETLSNVPLTFFSLHNQVPTLGQWSWAISTPDETIQISNHFASIEEFKVETRWLNSESLKLLSSFGKRKQATAAPNSIQRPTLYQIFNYEAANL